MLAQLGAMAPEALQMLFVQDPVLLDITAHLPRRLLRPIRALWVATVLLAMDLARFLGN
jgi:hypothetical protein